MEMYKKISLIETSKDAEDVIDEFLDRFGELPRASENLISISYVRATLARVGITRVTEKAGVLLFTIGECDLALCAEVLAEVEGLSMRSSPEPHLTLRPQKGERTLKCAVRVANAFETLWKNEKTTPQNQ